MICDRGDVVIVPFPFVDVAAHKRRPSVILSSRAFNQSNGHSICVMVTTAAHSRWDSDVTIADLPSAGLPHPCLIRWKVFTLPNETLLRRAGRLGGDDRNALDKAERDILG